MERLVCPLAGPVSRQAAIAVTVAIMRDMQPQTSCMANCLGAFAVGGMVHN